MLAIYAAELSIGGDAAEAWRTVRAAVRLAAGSPHGGWPQDSPIAAGMWEPGDGSVLRWTTEQADGVGRLWTLSVDDAVPGERRIRSRCTVRVGVGVEARGCTVQVLEELRPVAGALAPVPKAPVRGSALTREVVARSNALDGVHRLRAAPMLVDADTFGPVSILATDPARGRPVVLVQDAAPLAAQLAAELAGVGHIVALTSEHGAELVAVLELGALAPGDVLVLWPGWQLGDEWPTRETWTRGAFLAEPEVAARPIVADVLAASVLHVSTFEIVDAVRDALVRARVEALVAEEAAPEALSTEGPERPPGEPTLPPIDVASWEADLRALAEARQELDDLRDETRRLDNERDDLVALLSTRFEEEVARAVELRTGPNMRGPRSLGAAIEQAAELPHLVVLPDAIEQARAWPFLQPAKVLDHLRVLDALVARWQQGALHEGLHAAIVSAGLPWARDVSASAHRRFPQDYTVRWAGRALLLGPHLRYGTGAPTRQCRIYCAVVADPRTLVIGHVGAHLRGHRDR